MKHKIIQAFLISACTVGMLLQPLTAYAVTEGSINEGESVIIESDGQTGSTTSGSSNSNTNTSSGESSSSTSGSTNETIDLPDHVEAAAGAQNDIRDILRDYISSILESTNQNGLGIDHLSTGSIYQTGVQKLSKDDIAKILSLVDIYEKNYDPEYDGWCSNKLNEDRAIQGDLTGGDANYYSLDEKTKKKIKDKIAEKEGLNNPHTNSSLFQFIGTDGTNRQFSFNLDQRVPFFVSPKDFDNAFPTTGFRTDLIQLGFNDAGSWSERFEPLNRMTSNAMEDYLTVALIREYHINTVKEGAIEVIDYTSDVRKWVVTDQEFEVGEAIPKEHIIDEKVTNNPRHDFEFSGYSAGTYYVIPAQEAKYETSLFVSYDICDYLFDAETQNLLYFNEKLVDNGKGGSIKVETKEETGFVPTGDKFKVTVNGLNDVEIDGSATERVD